MQDYYRNGYYRKSLVYTPDCDCESDELDKIYVLYKTVEIQDDDTCRQLYLTDIFVE